MDAKVEAGIHTMVNLPCKEAGTRFILSNLLALKGS